MKKATVSASYVTSPNRFLSQWIWTIHTQKECKTKVSILIIVTKISSQKAKTKLKMKEVIGNLVFVHG